MSKKTLLIVSILLLIVLTGCWSRRELNELSIVTAIAIDKVEEKYKVTAQILNVDEIVGETQGNRPVVSTYTMEGRTVFEALRMLITQTPRKLYVAHLRLLVLGEDIAKEGIQKPIDFLSRDHEFRTDFFIVISKEKDAESILNVLTPIEKNPAVKIYNSIEDSEQAWAPTKGVRLNELITKLIAEGDNPTLTGVFITGEKKKGGAMNNVERIPSPTMIEIDHLGVFKGDQLIGWLNKDEGKGYNYITDNVQTTLGVREIEGTSITIEIFNSTTDVKALVKDQEAKIVVSMELEGSIGEVYGETTIDEEMISKVEKGFEEQLSELVCVSISKAKEFKTDIFGFGEKIHIKDPKLWKDLKDTWNEEGFVNLEVIIEPSVKIRRTGTIQNAVYEKGGDE